MRPVAAWAKSGIVQVSGSAKNSGSPDLVIAHKITYCGEFFIRYGEQWDRRWCHCGGLDRANVLFRRINYTA